MSYPTHGKRVFLDRQDHDGRCLADWRETPRTFYAHGLAEGAGWHHDRYEELIAADSSGRLFARAADLIMRYQFYPPGVLRFTADFSQQERWAQPGDRILQRVRVVRLLGLPVVEVLTMNEVCEVIDEPERHGFCCVTTAVHDEVGQWSVWVEWRDRQQVVLVMEALSRPGEGLPDYLKPLLRRLQLRAHRLGLAAFRERLFGEYRERPEPTREQALGVAGGAALLAVLWAVWRRRSRPGR